MKTATIREAQHHLSKLVNQVITSGAELILTRRGEQVCKIAPLSTDEKREVDWKTIHQKVDEQLGQVSRIDLNLMAHMREGECF